MSRLAAIYSARSTEIIFSIEYVCPTLRKVPITRHLSPTEQGFSGSWPEAVRSIVVVADGIMDNAQWPCAGPCLGFGQDAGASDAVGLSRCRNTQQRQ